ncbi:MAG TPA: PBP1A family penicillin-binding protein [Rhizomicrobium sp.]|nr:PBP1A family penicillin-binding protein [Rhizomicrobium sp.]
MPGPDNNFEDQLQIWLARGRRWAPLFTIVVTSLAVPAAILYLLPSLLGLFAAPLDPHVDLYAVNRPLAFTFLDANGEEAGHRGAVVGERLHLEDMPAYLPAAFIAMEDRRFYIHNGIDPLGLMRAVLADLRAGHFVAGGSTISQQTAKIVYTGQERTMSRKLTELMDAAGLEQSLSKKQILELYLNRIYLGSAAYGVDGAARVYFGVSARNLTLPQAAMLATLTRAPSVFSPRRDLPRAQERAGVVLDAMTDTGAITKIQAADAKAHPAMVVDRTGMDARNFFLDTAADQAMKLATQNGAAPSADLIVHTTLEPKLQEAARLAATQVIGKYGRRDRVHEAAVVMLKLDGAVSALIGGTDYETSTFNRAIQARRQPGSAFKPFVYLAALEAGISPWDTRDDEPVDINGYQPANFGNQAYGTLTLADALAHSVNTITVNLGQEVGIDKVIGAARRTGISSPLTPTPSLALGTSVVTPLELTGAYAAFANGGYRVYPYFVTEVDLAGGKALYRRRAPASQRVIGSAVDRDLLAMMWNVIATGTGASASLAPREAAGKTGTTQNSQDAWFVGFTTDYVAGVWVGNDDNSATRGVTGGTLPAMIWKSAMRAAEKGLPATPLDRSPPQEANDQGFLDRLFSSNDGPRRTDDEAVAPLQSQNLPDNMPPAPPRRHSGGILGWLFGDDEADKPPPSSADGLIDGK